MKQTLTILGGGATGMAAAYHFTRQGISVLLCDTAEREHFLEDIQEQRGIRLNGVCDVPDEKVLPQRITTDFAQAMAHGDHVLVCASADRQELLARRCAPYITEKHSFLLSPGNFASVGLRTILGPQVQLGELSDNLWPCRMTGPAQVLLGLPLGPKWAAAYPATDTPALLERWRGYLELKEGTNILETSLNSPNVVSHVAGSVLNAAAVERAGGTFAFFRDGLSPAVIRVLDTVEKERNQVLNFLGLRAYSKTAPLLTALEKGDVPGFEVFRILDGPVSLEHRYISEDAQCGVALLLSIGQEYGLRLPITEAAVRLAECINAAAYISNGRTLARYGLTDLSREELLDRITSNGLSPKSKA